MRHDCIKIRNIYSLGHFPKESSLYHGEISFSLKNNHVPREKEFKLFRAEVWERPRQAYALGVPPPTEERTRMGTSTKILLNLKFYIIIFQLPLCSLVLPAWLRGCPPTPHPMAIPQVCGPSSVFLAGKGGQPSTLSCDQILLGLVLEYITLYSTYCASGFFGEDKRRERKGP